MPNIETNVFMTMRSSSSSWSSSCATAALLRLLVAAIILLLRNQPVVSATEAAAVACERTVLMSTNDVLMAGQRRTNAEAGLHLDLQPNGDLQLWRDIVGPDTNFETTSALVWSSGGIINAPMTNVTTTVYQTVMQNDGRLVTFGVNGTSRERLDAVWMTNAHNSVGPAYSLAVDCRNGVMGAGNLGIFRGPPQQANPEKIWTADTLDIAATAAAATIDAQTTPLVEDTVNTTAGLGGCTTTNATILMKSGDFMYSGKLVVDYDRGVYLHQTETGQLKIRVGTPENPGSLLWESGWAMTAVVAAATGDESSFYTKFESTSNLVTWKANPADSGYEVVWETATFRPPDIYYLVFDCWNRIAVYQGHPHNDGVVVWTTGTTASESAGAEILPIPRPTAPPTDAPTRQPTGVVGVVDPTGAPTTRPSSTVTETETGTSSATTPANTTGSMFVIALFSFALF